MKKFVLICSLALCVQGAMAQWGQGWFSSPNQQLVEQAVRGGILWMERDYQLLDTVTGTRYGLDNREEFGRSHSLAFRVGRGLVVTDPFVHPWQEDSRFREWRDSVYVPVCSKARYRELADSVMRDATFGEDAPAVLKADVLYRLEGVTMKEEGFAVDTSTGKQEGWLVWITTPDVRPGRASKLSLVTYRQTLELKAGEQDVVLPKPVADGLVVGGLFAVPHVPRAGVLEFRVVGVAYRAGDQWRLWRLQPEVTPTEPARRENRLTPVATRDSVTVQPAPVVQPEEEVVSEQSKKKKKNRKRR